MWPAVLKYYQFLEQKIGRRTDIRKQIRRRISNYRFNRRRTIEREIWLDVCQPITTRKTENRRQTDDKREKKEKETNQSQTNGTFQNEYYVNKIQKKKRDNYILAV